MALPQARRYSPRISVRKERAIRLERTPMGEEAGAEAMADSVLFLIDGPRAITGTVLTVDGGFSARW